MILLIAIGWVVAIPILVVVGLYAASVFSRGRHRETESLDATTRAREFVGVAEIPPRSPRRLADLTAAGWRRLLTATAEHVRQGAPQDA